MKRMLCLLCLVFLITGINAQKLPSNKKILGTLRLANQYFMNKWPDAGKPIFTNIERPGNIWTRAVYYEGLMKLYAIDKKKNILIMFCNGAKNTNGDCAVASKQEMRIINAVVRPILIYI